ncbi:hypothetical protein [Caulobacter sp. NIBR2454]|uniref:hypothetical protein n=1 Tax=Caulobacter sp. NIBR2454 TaxID=3015996 RepID=UPI0022B723F6|nr:hypothetical protein [Caulobacter sp. NIBR2454]
MAVLVFAGHASAAENSKPPVDDMRCLAASMFVAKTDTNEERGFAVFTYFLGRLDVAAPGRATAKEMRAVLRKLTRVEVVADALLCNQAYNARDAEMIKLIDEVTRWNTKEVERAARGKVRNSFNEDGQR